MPCPKQHLQSLCLCFTAADPGFRSHFSIGLCVCIPVCLGTAWSSPSVTNYEEIVEVNCRWRFGHPLLHAYRNSVTGCVTFLVLSSLWYSCISVIIQYICNNTGHAIKECQPSEGLSALKTLQLSCSVFYITVQVEPFQNIFQNVGISCDSLG